MTIGTPPVSFYVWFGIGFILAALTGWWIWSLSKWLRRKPSWVETAPGFYYRAAIAGVLSLLYLVLLFINFSPKEAAVYTGDQFQGQWFHYAFGGIMSLTIAVHLVVIAVATWWVVGWRLSRSAARSEYYY